MTVATDDRGHAPPLTAAKTRSFAAAAAGPVLIVAAVLVVLQGFWLHPQLTNQHVDHLSFWLPRWCFLGTNLAAGHLPTWLPNQFGGVPFLSDPQSGWLNLPAMLLFGASSCARAMGLFVTLQPILAGLGLYLFCRKEGLGRAAATGGGLTLALIMAGSRVALSVPFSGTLAWTALALGGAAGFAHAESWARRLAWLAFAELCLVQVAAAHLTDGVLLAGMAVGLYLLARSVAQIRAGERTGGQAAIQVVLPFVLLPLLGAAVALPRLGLLPRTSVGQGYLELDRLAERLSGVNGVAPFAAHGAGPWWGTAFARGPGGYAGAVAVLLVPVAFTWRRWRLPAAGFAVLGAAGYVLNLNAVVTSPSVRSLALSTTVGQLWLRDPYRLRYVLPLALGALAGYGLQAWFDRAPPGGRRSLARLALWLTPSVAVFVALPLLAGARAASYVALGLAALAVVPLLLRVAGRIRLAWVLPAVMAVELVAVGLAAQGGAAAGAPASAVTGAPDRGLGKAFPAFRPPDIDPADFLAPGPIARAMEGSTGRYVTFDPAIATDNPRGFLLHQDRDDWSAYANGRSILFRLEEIQGYSPVQLLRYWTLVRRVNREAPIFYNTAFFQRLDRAVLRLLAVEWVIQPSRLPPPAGSSPTAREGRYALYRLQDPTRRASLVTSWERVPSGRGLDRVLDPGFDGERTAIVEGGPVPPSGPPGAAGSAVYREIAPGHVRVQTRSPGPGLLVVRNAYDDNWSAAVDGVPAEVLPADYLVQGIPVPGGIHVVEMIYRDPLIGVGLAVSGGAWALILIALVWLWRAERRRPTARDETVLWPNEERTRL